MTKQNSKQTLEELMSELEEYGNLHQETCSVMNEDECDCDMQGMKAFIKKVYAAGGMAERREIATRLVKDQGLIVEIINILKK